MIQNDIAGEILSMNSGCQPGVLGDGRMEYVTAWGLRRDLEYGVCQGWGGVRRGHFLPTFFCLFSPAFMFRATWQGGGVMVTFV